jgi:predicted Zn-dependent protease
MTDWRWKTIALAAVGVLCLGVGGQPVRAQATPAKPADPMTALRSEVAAAEHALQSGERQTAESHYRKALYTGWMLTGALAVRAGRLANARDAFERAARAIAASEDAQRSLAIVDLQMGDAASALPILTRLAAAHPKQSDLSRLLAQAVAANGQSEEAGQALEAARADPAAMRLLDPGGVGKVSADARQALAAQIASTLGRIYLNLGVMEAQANRFARAGEFFEQAATLDPSLPQVQYSLGVAMFNAQDFSKAGAALAKALERDPTNADARRMLALSAMNTEDYAKAADLLAHDPQREADLSLQFAYGVSLVRSGRAGEAEEIFSTLVAAHGDSPELNVVLGQAHAEQGDYDAAVQSLRRALALEPDVAEANAALGVIYLKQGHLADATRALEAELKTHPSDVRARVTLATVLDLDNHSDRAIAELRTVLAARPDHANARYLLGKILLAGGSIAPATEQLEIAARLAPEDANVHYQLAQAYQKAGRTELAQRQFEVFQELKNKKRGGAS